MADKTAGLMIKVESDGVKTATNRLTAFSAKAATADAELRKLVASATMANQSFAPLSNSLKQVAEGLRSSSTGATQSGRSLSKTTAEARKASVTLDRLNGSAHNASSSLAKIGSVSLVTNNATNRLGTSAKKAGDGLKSISKEAPTATRGLERIAERSIVAGAAFIAFNKARELATRGVETTAAYESLGKQLEFVTGSAYGAAEAMSFLYAEADRTGQRFLSVAPTFGKLQFAMQQAGLTSRDTRELFKAVGSAAATFGLEQSEVNGVLRAFVQVASKGKVQAEELRGQIGERIPGAFGLAAEAMGVTIQELSLMLERGEVLATDLLPKLAVKMNEVFGQDMDNKTNTLRSSINKLTTEWEKFLGGIGETGVFRDFIEGLRTELKFLRNLTGLGRDFDVTVRKALDGSDRFKDTLDIAAGATFDELVTVLVEIDRKQREFEDRIVKAEGSRNRRLKRGLENQLTVLDTLEFRIQSIAESLRKSQTDAEEAAAAAIAAEAAEVKRALAISSAFDGFQRISDSVRTVPEKLQDEWENATSAVVSYYRLMGKDIDAEGQEVLNRLQNTYTEGMKSWRASQKPPETPPVDIKPFEDAFQRIKDSVRTVPQEMEAEWEDATYAVVSYYHAMGKDIDAEGETLLAILEAQYKRNLKNWEENQRQMAAEATDAYQIVISGTRAIEDALINAARNGKFAWGDMAQYMIAEIQRVLLRSLILRPLFSSLGTSLTAQGFTNVGAAFLKAAGPTEGSADGAYIPAGRSHWVGEEGPEIISGPAVVTSTRTTADKIAAMGNQRQASSPTVVNVSLAPGVTPQQFAQLEQALRALNSTFEYRVASTMGNMMQRKPGMR